MSGGDDASTLAIVARDGGSILPVAAQPGARRAGVLGVRAGALRVAVNAPPEKGKANAAIRAVLVEALGCKAAAVELVSGRSARQKRFFIAGLEPEALRRRLSSIVEESGVPRIEDEGFHAETQRSAETQRGEKNRKVSRRDAEVRGDAEG